jgi:hypothetical protein
MSTFAERAVIAARSYIGQKEILGNKGFKNAEFQNKMINAGWHMGYAWCTLLAEIAWKDAANAMSQISLYEQFDKLFSASAIATYANFAHSANIKVSQMPVPGAVVIWKHGVDPAGWQGHAGIVCTVTGSLRFTSVEGNTAGTDPNIREGYDTLEKPHKLGLPPNPHGLNIVGFILPPLV